jgi:hypothetical protein
MARILALCTSVGTDDVEAVAAASLMVETEVKVWDTVCFDVVLLTYDDPPFVSKLLSVVGVTRWVDAMVFTKVELSKAVSVATDEDDEEFGETLTVEDAVDVLADVAMLSDAKPLCDA